MWSPTLNQQGLSQGDVLVDVPVGATKVPLTFISKEPFPQKGGRVVYTRYDTLQEYPNEPGAGNWIAKGRIGRALVISHDCDLDDVKDTERVVCAPVYEISRVTSSAEDRERIMRGARPTYVALPGVPGVGDCYAELRSLFPLDRHLFSVTTSRLCSMTDEAVAMLRAQLVHYFTRLDPDQFVKTFQSQIFEEKKNQP